MALYKIDEPEPDDVLPADEVILLREGIAAAGRAAETRVEHAPPVSAAAVILPQRDAQGVVPPSGKGGVLIPGGGKVHVHQFHPGRRGKAKPGQRLAGGQLQRGQVLCRPVQGFRLGGRPALGICIGQQGVPHGQLGGLVLQAVTVGFDVEPQGVGTDGGPGVQLGPAPVQRKPAQTGQHAPQRQRGTPHRHFPAG